MSDLATDGQGTTLCRSDNLLSHSGSRNGNQLLRHGGIGSSLLTPFQLCRNHEQVKVGRYALRMRRKSTVTCHSRT